MFSKFVALTITPKKMKLNSTTLTFLFIAVFASCASKADKIAETLQQAEKCMETHPDSALHILNGISNPDKLREKDLADYLLLLTQAKDKNYMDITADSSITFAINYYKKNGDKRRYGRALFYYGRVLQEKQKITQAMTVFLDARQILEKTKEYKILGLLCVNISVLNRDQSLYEEAISCCHQAISYYYSAKDTLGVAYAYQTMGSSFFLKQEMDSVSQCVSRSLQLLANNPIRLRIGAFKMLGMMYSFEKQYLKAEKYFLEIIDNEPDKKRLTSHFMSLGRLYRLMGKIDAAEKYLKLCLDSHNMFTRSDAYYNLAELAKLNREYEYALVLKEKSDSLLYIAENEKTREKIIQLQTEYQKEKLEKEKLQSILKNRTLLFLFVIALVLLLGVAYYFKQKYWHAKLQMDQIFKSLERNNRQIGIYLNQINQFKQQKDKNKIEVDFQINKLNHQIEELVQENMELRSKVDICELLKILKNGGVIAENLTTNEWNKIFYLTNCLYSDILIDLKEEYVHLTKHDIELLSFILLRFTNKELMLIFDSKSTRTIFKAKYRLKERLKLRKEDSLDDFLQKKYDE